MVLSTLLIKRVEPVLDISLILIIDKSQYLDDISGGKYLVELNLSESAVPLQVRSEVLNHFLFETVLDLLNRLVELHKVHNQIKRLLRCVLYRLVNYNARQEKACMLSAFRIMPFERLLYE